MNDTAQGADFAGDPLHQVLHLPGIAHITGPGMNMHALPLESGDDLRAGCVSLTTATDQHQISGSPLGQAAGAGKAKTGKTTGDQIHAFCAELQARRGFRCRSSGQEGCRHLQDHFADLPGLLHVPEGVHHPGGRKSGGRQGIKYTVLE